MSAKHIILRNSQQQAEWEALTPEQQANEANFKGKKFRVIFGGYRPSHRKPLDTITETPGGWTDISPGPVFWRAQYVIRTWHTVPAEETEANLGTKGDLEAYFLLNNPTGTPSNVLTLVDHEGVEHDVFWPEELAPEPLTTIIDGETGIFMIPITLIQFQAVAA